MRLFINLLSPMENNCPHCCSTRIIPTPRRNSLSSRKACIFATCRFSFFFVDAGAVYSLFPYFFIKFMLLSVFFTQAEVHFTQAEVHLCPVDLIFNDHSKFPMTIEHLLHFQ